MAEQAPTAWSGRVLLGPFWMLYAGPVGPTEPHAHHAFQIAVSGVALSPAPVRPEGAWQVVPPDCEHAVAAPSERALLLYLDPESREGRQLAQRVTPLPETWAQAGGELPPLEEGVVPVVQAILCHLGIAALAPRVLHPGVRRVVELLPGRLAQRPPVSLPELAHLAGVSESRLSHLLAEQLGLGLPGYVRWLRLRQAGQHLARGASLTEAAHAAGFSDGAHFTRTFRALFGLTPSAVSRFATWTVV